ncbi:MAG: MFS transporter [bacterium]
MTRLDTKPVRTDGLRGYVLPLARATTARAATFASVDVVTQLTMSELGASRFLVSVCSSLAWAGITLFSVFWGTLSDALRMRKRTVIVAGLLSTLMVFVPLMFQSLASLLVGRFLIEAFGAGVPPAILALLSERARPGHRAQRISVFTTAQAGGILAGMSLGGFLFAKLTTRGAYAAIASLSGITVLSSLLLPRERRASGAGALQASPWSGFAEGLGAFTRRFKAVSSFGLVYLYTGIAIRKAGVTGFFGLLQVYLREGVGLGPQFASSLTAINPLAQAALMGLVAHGSDRLGHRRFFLSGYLLTTIAPLTLCLFGSVWLIGLAFLISGLSFALFISGTTGYIGDLASDDVQAGLMGMMKTSQGIGGIVGPFVAGILSLPSALGFGGMFLAMAILIACGFLITVLGSKPEPLRDGNARDRLPQSR